MRVARHKKLKSAAAGRTLTAVCAVVVALSLVAFVTPSAQASISWDAGLLRTDVGHETEPAGNNTSLWFDPVNWSPTNPGESPPYLMPGTSNGETATDTRIDSGWDFSGEGVVYDPLGVDAANYALAAGADYDYPTEADPRFNRDTIWRLYVSTSIATSSNKLTIKSGELNVINADPSGDNLSGYVIVGRGGATPGLEGVIVQEGGTFTVNENYVAIGLYQGSAGNGVYDYHGGTLEVGLTNGAELRLAHGGSDGRVADTGKMIIRNGGEAGHIRIFKYRVAAALGGPITPNDSVATVEFHADADGTRPIQVLSDLAIDQEDDSAGSGSTRSAVLDLVLDEAPTVTEGVPMDLGLFDVNYSGLYGGVVAGESGIFYSDSILNGGLPYDEGAEISAIFGSKEYFWNITYQGEITWSDADNSVIDTLTGDPGGTPIDNDVILVGNRVEDLPFLAGDFNEDGIVDAADYTVWRDNLGLTGTALHTDGDYNDDGDVTEADYTGWKADFGMTLSPGSGALSATAVPEPSTLMLAVFVAVLWIGRGLTSRR